MKQGNKLQSTIQFGKKIRTSPTQQSPPQQMYSTKKPQPPKVYTFYQSTRNLNNSRHSFQTFEKKDSSYTSQELDENRRKTYKQGEISIKYNTQSRLDQNVNPTVFKKNINTPEVSCFKAEYPGTQSGHAYTPSLDMVSQNSSDSNRRYASTELVQSKIIKRYSDIEDQSKKISLNSSDFDNRLQIQNTKKYQNIQDEYYNLRERFTIIEDANVVLQKRNIDLVEEMLRSENTIKEYEQKQIQLQTSIKKNQDSLKITRNIITSLNDRIARLQKQNENLTKNAEQTCQSKLQSLQISKNEALKALQAQNFQLKLKIIDLNHDLEHSGQKSKKLDQEQKGQIQELKVKITEVNQKLQQAIEKEKKLEEDHFKQIQQKGNKIIFLELQVTRMNDRLGKLDSDLIIIDQENIRLDQQNKRLLQINTELMKLEPEVQRLSTQNNELTLQAMALNQKEKQYLKATQNNKEITEKLENCESTIEVYKNQKEFLRSEIQKLKIQIQKMEENYSPKKQSESIEELNNQIAASKGEISKLYSTLDEYIKAQEISRDESRLLKEQLLKNGQTIEKLKVKCLQRNTKIQNLQEQIEQRDGKIAQLNTNLMKSQLQMLDLKEELKHKKQKENQQTKSQINIHEKYLSEITKLEQQLLESQFALKSFQIYQEQAQSLAQKVSELEDTVKEYESKEILPIDSKIDQTQQGNEDNSSERLLKLEEVIQRIQMLQKEVDQKDQEIDNLNQIIFKKESQIEELQEEKSKSKSQRQITNEYLNQQFTTNLQLKEKLKIKEVEKELLQSQLTIIKNQIVELEKEMKMIQHYKFQFDNQENTISELENKLQQSEKNSQNLKNQLETLKELLRHQQQEYLLALDEEIKKICLIEEEDLGEIKRSSPPKTEEKSDHYSDQEKQCSSESFNSSEQHQLIQKEDQALQAWFQNIQEHSREQLISKLQQLNFVTKSLKMKVRDLSQMQQKSNDIIMSKIKVFEEIIQKYQQDINDLEQINQTLTREKNELFEKCQFNEGKIQWMDNINRQIEANLIETNDELVKVQIEFVNLKMQTEGQRESDNIRYQQTQSEIEKKQINDSNHEPLKEDIEDNYKKKENAIKELKKLSQEIQDSILKSEKEKKELKEAATLQKKERKQYQDQEQDQEVGIVNKMTDQQLEHQDRELYKFMEGQYEVQESQVCGVTYSIVVSQVDSEDEEIEESPEKQTILDQDIDRMIEEYPEELFEMELEKDSRENTKEKKDDNEGEKEKTKEKDEDDRRQEAKTNKKEEKEILQEQFNKQLRQNNVEIIQKEQSLEEQNDSQIIQQKEITLTPKKDESEEDQIKSPQIEKVELEVQQKVEDEQKHIQKDLIEQTE